MCTNKTFIRRVMVCYFFRNNKKAGKRGDKNTSEEKLMTATREDDEASAVGGAQCVVAYPDVSSSKEARTIGRLKLALELVSLGFLTMTVLFVWQITQKRPAATEQVSYAVVSGLMFCFIQLLQYHILNSWNWFIPGGTRRTFGLGGGGMFPETLILFQTKICDFPDPITDLTQNRYLISDRTLSKNCFGLRK